jgi:hypothetical protein
MLERRRAERLAKKKWTKQSAVFESEDRWKSLERELSSKGQIGPGAYLKDLSSGTSKKEKKDDQGESKVLRL